MTNSFDRNAPIQLPCNMVRLNNNLAALAQLADAEVSASKPNGNGGSLLGDLAIGVHYHGKKS